MGQKLARKLSVAETAQRLLDIGLAETAQSAFTFEDDARQLSYDYHTHRQHQLLYATKGTARIESEAAQFILPPQRAAWVPAHVKHATHVDGAETISLFFSPKLAIELGPSAVKRLTEINTVHVFEVPAVLREMMLYTRRWPLGRATQNRHAQAYFRALLLVVLDVAQRRAIYELPLARTELVGRAMHWVLEHLAEAQLEAAAKAVHTSARSLRRHFTAETATSFSEFVAQARLQRALALLMSTDQSVLDISLSVGFQSPSAFTQAFRLRTGETPREFRRRAVEL